MCCIPALRPAHAGCAQARLLGGRDGGLLAAIARDAGAAARLNALSARDRPAAANLNDEIAALEGPPVAVMAALRELGQVLHFWQSRAGAHAKPRECHRVESC